MPISYRPMREYMADNGISYYYLGNEGIDTQTLHRIRHDKPITTTTLCNLCRILKCQPENLIEYVSESDPTVPPHDIPSKPKCLYPRLRTCREAHNFTPQHLSEMIGISKQGYCRYETGECDIPARILLRLSHIYQVSIDFLLGETDKSL